MTTSNIVQPIPVDITKWLAGFIEITGGRLPTQEEWNVIVTKVGQAAQTQLPVQTAKKADRVDDQKKPEPVMTSEEQIAEAMKKWRKETVTTPTVQPWTYPRAPFDKTGSPWIYPPNYPPNYPWNDHTVVVD